MHVTMSFQKGVARVKYEEALQHNCFKYIGQESEIRSGCVYMYHIRVIYVQDGS